jgi:hypothetical protein
MKKLTVAVCLIICLFVNVRVLSAEDGSGQKGITLSAGYTGGWFEYKEFESGYLLDKDFGWLNGGYFEFRGDIQQIFICIGVEISRTNKATYDGALQNIDTGQTVPYTARTPELIRQFEVDLGFKLLNFGNATLSPLVGIGYRDWIRGQDGEVDYQEDYTWWYAALGINISYRYGNWLFGFKGCIQFPISPEMTTNFAGNSDNMYFNIKSRPGYHAEVYISFDVYRANDIAIFLFGVPYYQRWNIGASDYKVITQGGVPVGDGTGGTYYAYEPKSNTNVYGFRFGVGVNF